MWSKKTGPGHVNSWGMADWRTRSWWGQLAPSIARFGHRGRISFCLVSNSKRSGARGVTGASVTSCPGPLCSPGILALKERRELRDRYESLDPFALKDELEIKLKQI